MTLLLPAAAAEWVARVAKPSNFSWGNRSRAVDAPPLIVLYHAGKLAARKDEQQPPALLRWKRFDLRCAHLPLVRLVVGFAVLQHDDANAAALAFDSRFLELRDPAFPRSPLPRTSQQLSSGNDG
jgi:hypothetical protein